MTVVNDLSGDEDDLYLWCEFFKIYMHEVIYKQWLDGFTEIKQNE